MTNNNDHTRGRVNQYRPITSEEIGHMKNMYNNGYGYGSIAHKLDRGTCTVRKYVRPQPQSQTPGRCKPVSQCPICKATAGTIKHVKSTNNRTNTQVRNANKHLPR